MLDEENPQPKSSWAAIGLYFYDEHVTDLAKTLKPSSRGEYEITDLNNLYMRERRLKAERIGRGFAWFDAGTLFWRPRNLSEYCNRARGS